MSVMLKCHCKKMFKLGTKQCPDCGNRTFRYKVRVQDKARKWKTRTVDSLALARQIEAKFKTEAIEGEIFEQKQKAPKLNEVWEKYFKTAKATKRSWKADEQRYRDHIGPMLGDKTMNAITSTHIDQMLEKLREGKSTRGKPFAPATIKQCLVLLKRLYNWAIERKLYTGPNPCGQVTIPKFDNRVNNTLSKKELMDFLNLLDSWPNERARLVCKFALYTGKRRSEILNLKWSAVDLENGLVSYQGDTTKNSDTQTLPVNDNALSVLSRCYELKNSDYVFPCKTGKYYHSFTASYYRFKDKHRIKLRFHDLRHQFATMLASSGKVDLFTLQNLLGHKSIAMTQRYAHLMDESLRKATAVMDGIRVQQ